MAESQKAVQQMNIEEISNKIQGLGIQLQSLEIFEIAKSVKSSGQPINFLVFGIGNDSHFWNELNAGGRTIFLEDNIEWFDKIKGKFPELEAYLVDYKTNREVWRDLIDKPELLRLDIPAFMHEIPWDVILVDAPREQAESAPGRMKSIYMASKLVKKDGDVFVHDAEREIESEYCKKYLKPENLVSRVEGCARLEHYKIS